MKIIEETKLGEFIVILDQYEIDALNENKSKYDKVIEAITQKINYHSYEKFRLYELAEKYWEENKKKSIKHFKEAIELHSKMLGFLSDLKKYC